MSGLVDRLTALQADGRLPSIVGGVLRDGVLVEADGVRADVGTGYRIGSITKTLTAVLVMQLRDEGLLDLDDPVGRFLPGTGYATATVADLLCHSSGMQSEPVGPWWERSDGGDFAALTAANDGSGAVAAAGEFFHYSNLAYALLGEVVARLRGDPWWRVVRSRLLGPLAMTRTTYGPVAPHAQGHSVEHFSGRLVEEPHTDTGAMAPAGQAWSTVADLATWAGVLAGRRPDVLATATAAEMAVGRLDPDYGLGLRSVDAGPRRLVGHTGSMPGFLASLFVDQRSGDGAVLLSDATTGLDTERAPGTLLADGCTGGPTEPWRPTGHLPDGVEPALGLWFWGSTAVELRWDQGRLQLRGVQSGRLQETFEVRDDGRVVGVAGYHRGEILEVHEHHLACATFVYTRTPYDPRAPIPGGVPG